MKLFSSFKNKILKKMNKNITNSDIIRKKKLKRLKKKYFLKRSEDSDKVVFQKYNIIDFANIKLEQRTYLYLRKLDQKYDICTEFAHVLYELIIFCEKYKLSLEIMTEIIEKVIFKFISKQPEKYDKTFLNFVNKYTSSMIEVLYLLMNKKIMLKEHFSLLSILPYIFI